MNIDITTSAGTPPTSPTDRSKDLTLPTSAEVARGLNYFDGRFLRAEDLNHERRAQRLYADLGNLAGGAGVVHGLSFSATGSAFSIGPGLAIDTAGRLLFVDRTHDLDVEALVRTASSTGTQDSGTTADTGSSESRDAAFDVCAQPTLGAVTPGTGLYVVVLERVQVAEGKEDVLGRLCDSGCGSVSDSRFIVDTVRVRAVPLIGLELPVLPNRLGPVHERSQVASAYFERERQLAASLLHSPGLASGTWCSGAGIDTSNPGVPIAVIKSDGSAILWYDTWTARRERMEPPTSRYWARLVELRPWSVFLAQVLQFQCQFAELSPAVASSFAARGVAPAGRVTDPSPGWISDLTAAMAHFRAVDDEATARRVARGISRVRDLQSQVTALDTTSPRLAASDQMLLDAGIVTTPAAGYLPVSVSTGQALRRELELLFGGGVDLRVCAVRRDQIPHELERAAHMDRISLIKGLAEPSAREQVDVLVPDGVIEDASLALASHGFAVDLSIGPGFPAPPDDLRVRAAASRDNLAMQGVARVDGSSGLTVRVAVAGTDAGSLNSVFRPLADLIRRKESVADATAKLSRLSLGEALPSLPTLRRIGTGAVAAGSEMRARGDTKGFARVPGAAGEVLAESGSLWTARDPFAMVRGDVAAFHAEWDVAMPRATTYGVSLVVDGRISWVSGAGITAGTSVTVSVEGFAVVSGTGITDKETHRIQRTLTLIRRSDGSQQTVEIRDAKSPYLATARWTGPPYVSDGELGASDQKVGGLSSTYGAFHAVESSAIRQAGNEYRDAAIHAIQVLSALRPDDPMYVERGFAELFPDTESGDLSLVRPLLPWVLFRRRRRHECEGEVDVQAQGTSGVAAWVATADSPRQAMQYADRLTRGSGDEVPWTSTPVEIVLFETGTATMRSSSASWREHYHAAGGGNVIWFAGYARALSAAADPPIGLSRAAALADATEPVATMDPDGQMAEVTSPPSSRMLGTTAGSIFLISYPVPEGVSVVAVDGLDEKFKETVAAIKAFDPDELERSQPGDALKTLATSSRLVVPSTETRESALKVLDEFAADRGADDDHVRTAWTWISDEATDQMRRQARSVAVAFADGLHAGQGREMDVALPPASDDVVRIYVVVEPPGE